MKRLMNELTLQVAPFAQLFETQSFTSINKIKKSSYINNEM